MLTLNHRRDEENDWFATYDRHLDTCMYQDYEPIIFAGMLARHVSLFKVNKAETAFLLTKKNCGKISEKL